MFGGFPKAGDSFKFENLTVTVLNMVDGRRVDKVLVRVEPEEKEE
jgi:CBS domain containing-hemolysin-like protein